MSDKLFRSIGLMSGTSLDGIDVAFVETDGKAEVEPLAFASFPYESPFREKLRACLGSSDRDAPDVRQTEGELTLLHADAVNQFLVENMLEANAIDLIGFHGQTLWHDPAAHATVQIGDGALLAEKTGINVINDFRSADVAAGGQGAPLVPLYHRALATELPKPVAIINIGGVSNITYIGGDEDSDLLAFDLGPGGALIDDWVFSRTGRHYDESGKLAAAGKADPDIIAHFLRHPFFQQKPPKSLDRDAFRGFVPEKVSVEDGAATLTLITVWSIVKGLEFFSRKPSTLFLTGGGRHNLTILRWIEQLSGIKTASVDELGWSGDGMEAEAFAYLAVRSHLDLPLTLPTTTGVAAPTLGGKKFKR